MAENSDSERIIKLEVEMLGVKERQTETHQLLERIGDKIENIDRNVMTCNNDILHLKSRVAENAKKADFLPTILLTAVITAAATGLIGWSREVNASKPDVPQEHSQTVE